MGDGEINYKTYSDAELRQAFQTIDREIYPVNFRNLETELHARSDAGNWPLSRVPVATEESQRPQAPEELEPEVIAFMQELRELSPKTPVTHALIAVNVVVFAAMALAGAGILDSNAAVHVAWGSNLVPVTVAGQWWRLGTSMFLHFGVLHLFFNMWVLFANGPLAERMFGSVRFLLLYLFAGLCGSLASAAWHPVANSAGASGAIFGVLGGMAAFLLAGKHPIPEEVVRAQGKSIAAFVLFNVLNGLAHQGIDNAAHMGGLIGGFLIGLPLARPLTVESRREPRMTYVASIVVVAGLLLFGAANAVTYQKGRLQPEDRWVAAATWFDYYEGRTIAAYNRIVANGQSGKLSDSAIADQLGTEVVSFYAEAKDRLDWNPTVAGDYDDARRRLANYLATRHESVAKLEQGLRSGDQDLVAQAMELQRQAEALAEEFRTSNDAKGAP